MPDPMLGYLSIAIMAIAATFWGRALMRVEIPRNRSPFIFASIIAAALGITSLAGESGWLAGTLAGLSIFVAAFFLLTVAIGGQKVGDAAIQTGAVILTSGPLTNTARPTTRPLWRALRHSSSFFAATGDLTVSPSCGDGKNSDRKSTNLACPFSQSAPTRPRKSPKGAASTDCKRQCCPIAIYE